MTMSEANFIAIPVDSNCHRRSTSFSSSPRSSPLSPIPSSPTTLYFPVSPQDSYSFDTSMIFGDEQPHPHPQQKQQEHQQQDSKSVSTFINKLFKMVNDERHQDLITWSPSGRSFLIMDSKQFSKGVLPEYFKHGNFSSFVRQLNMYGFRKINKTPRGKRGVQRDEVWEFSHPKFERENPERLSDIKRKVVESDVLRRETDDMQACFNTMQASQNDLLEQFRVLQGNFTDLIQGFEDLKRNQNQIQTGLRRLAGLEHVKVNPPVPSAQPSEYAPSVLITSPQSNALQAHMPNQAGMFLDHFSPGSPSPPSPMSIGGMSSASSYFSLGDESIPIM